MGHEETLHEPAANVRTVMVLVCRVGQEPTIEHVPTELTHLQGLVGGFLEVVGLGDGVNLWCNETGRIDGLPFNRDVPGRAPWVPEEEWHLVIPMDEGLARPGEMGVHRVHGDFFLARSDEDGEMTSLTDSELARYATALGASPPPAIRSLVDLLRIPLGTTLRVVEDRNGPCDRVREVVKVVTLRRVQALVFTGPDLLEGHRAWLGLPQGVRLEARERGFAVYDGDGGLRAAFEYVTQPLR